jgi:hypothetical protein
MIDLIISLAMFFLVPVFVLPFFIILAMLVRGITPIYKKHPASGLENRRAKNLSEIAVINTSLSSSPLDDPCINRREKVHGSLAHLIPLQSS